MTANTHTVIDERRVDAEMVLLQDWEESCRNVYFLGVGRWHHQQNSGSAHDPRMCLKQMEGLAGKDGGCRYMRWIEDDVGIVCCLCCTGRSQK